MAKWTLEGRRALTAGEVEFDALLDKVLASVIFAPSHQWIRKAINLKLT